MPVKHYKKYGMIENIRKTLEYDEARVLVLRKAALRAEIREINNALKKLRYLSSAAVTLAKMDVEQSMKDDPGGKPNLTDTP